MLNKVSPVCDQPSTNGHTQSGVYDLAQTLSGEIITLLFFKVVMYSCTVVN